MNLIAIYVSSSGPLCNRCLSFDPRYQLRQEKTWFQLELRERDQEDSPFWSLPYERVRNVTTSIDNVNLIIGENGTGKTSLVFLLESMLVQLAHGGGTENKLFSGFSIWVDDRRQVGGMRRFYLFHTEEEPPELRFLPEREELTIQSVQSAEDELRNSLAARLILVSASFENRFFEWKETVADAEEEPEPVQNLAPLLEFTPQSILCEGFDAAQWLSPNSVYRSEHPAAAGVILQKDKRGEFQRLKSAEAYFASQILLLMKGCKRGIAQFIEPEGPKESPGALRDHNPVRRARLVLADATGGRERLKTRLLKLKQEYENPLRVQLSVGETIRPIINEIAYHELCIESFRRHQLVCLCLRVLEKCQSYLDGRGVNAHVGESLVASMKTMGRLLTSKRSLGELEQRMYRELARQRTILENEILDYLSPELLIELRIAVEQGMAYLSFQSVFSKWANQDRHRMSLSLLEVERLMAPKLAEQPVELLVEQAVSTYLAYSLLDDDEDVIWKLPTLRVEASSGQMNLLMLASFLRILADDQSQLGQNVSNLLLIDEADLSLHPEWQRTFLYRLLGLLYQAQAPHWHIIVATHSPILISDFPRSHIICLREGNTPSEDEAETFAQNIYSIYQKEMNLSSAIGEFARQYLKIINEKIQTMGEDEGQIQEIEGMIHRIGDQFLQTAYISYLEESRQKQAQQRMKALIDRSSISEESKKTLLKELREDQVRRD